MDQAFLVDNMQKKTPEWFQRLVYKSSLEFQPNQNTFIKKWVYNFITLLLENAC